MKVKDITLDCRLTIFNMKKTSQWKDSEFKIYDSKTTRFVHEKSKEGQILSISGKNKPVTKKEFNFAIRKLMRLNKNDNVYVYTSPAGVLYIRQDI
ncbi:hypothetical protein NSA56_11175 [Oceanobacillus caeni]|uniref:hypothetical protein n=1 Tax=Oceanobacillus caeni TaxID=405946 RepID=UPI00214A0C8A|nr:hypothetical protein [Oceanobacillus caeni]MCR1834956.1 hypothetical protein [Oceanobacillus caeni]